MLAAHIEEAAMKTCLLAVGLLLAALNAAPSFAATAVFAGGCFWCMEEAFDHVPGVTATISGYTGGASADPTYEQVSSGGSGHFEAVKVEYDPAKVSYEMLLAAFWRNVDPLDPSGQFCDKGSQYRSAIFVGSDAERRLAEASLAAVAKQLNQPVATIIEPASAFYAAEDYHQDFYRTNSARYRYYKYGCGRVQRLEEVWGKPAT
jgi:peptide-methionine (S)-S-oxide reductase